MEINTPDSLAIFGSRLIVVSRPHPQIHIYKNALGHSFDEIMFEITELDKTATADSPITRWNDWQTGNDGDLDRYTFGQQKRFDDKRCASDPKYSQIFSKLHDPILIASNHYAEVHGMDIGTIAPLSLSRYYTEKFMGPHTDSYDGDQRPTISVVMYLNDDYEGGDLYFREQDISIKASSGDIVIFPSKPPFFHESKPVISGIKYICPGFWNKL